MPSLVQIAYFVTDIRSSALDMAEKFGAGPFFISSRIELARCEHRGKKQKFVHSSAYGQWGEIMLELVQQDEEGPSPFRDMYGPGKEGIHHGAMFVDSVSRAIARYQQAGLQVATRATTLHGDVEFAFIDTRSSLGHMLEIYEPVEVLRNFYSMIKAASVDWDGQDPVRERVTVLN
jgi:hypothetical protein